MTASQPASGDFLPQFLGPQGPAEPLTPDRLWSSYPKVPKEDPRQCLLGVEATTGAECQGLISGFQPREELPGTESQQAAGSEQESRWLKQIGRAHV